MGVDIDEARDPQRTRDTPGDLRLFIRLLRCVEDLARSPDAAEIKDLALVRRRFAEDVADLLPLMDLEVVLQKMSPEQRLAGLDPEQRLASLDSEQRLAGLSAVDRIRALPDDVLHGLRDDYIATLAPEVQAAIRARRGR